MSGVLEILAGFTMCAVVPFSSMLVTAGCSGSENNVFLSSDFVEDDADGGDVYT